VGDDRSAPGNRPEPDHAKREESLTAREIVPPVRTLFVALISSYRIVAGDFSSYR
jgi:hypothetical protein